jgi:hypothetical protein
MKASLLCSENPAVKPFAGSRLPAPLAWPLLEAWHPGSQDSGGGGGGGGGGRSSNGGGSGAGAPGTSGGAARTVGAALTWLLGLEAAGSAYLALIPDGECLIPASEGLASREQIESATLAPEEAVTDVASQEAVLTCVRLEVLFAGC